MEVGTVRRGRLYGVGVGPGDPELMTIKARRLIATCPVVCIPKRNLADEGYAARIVAPYLGSDQEVLELEFPMSRDLDRLRAYWDRSAAVVWERLERGLDCVFVTEGDPLLYSTFVHLHDHMRQVHPALEVEVVPGVSSFLAAAARLGVSLADGSERIAVVSGVESAGAARELLERFDTVAFFKVSGYFELVRQALEELGRVEEAGLVTKATAPGQEEIITDIRTLRGGKPPYLSLLLVRSRHGG